MASEEAPDPTAYVWVTIPSGITVPETMAVLWLERARTNGYPEARLTHKVTIPATDIHGNMYVGRGILRAGPRIIVLRFGDNTEPEHKDTSVGSGTRIIDTTGGSKPRSTIGEHPTREIQARRPALVLDRDPLAGELEPELERIFAPIQLP